MKARKLVLENYQIIFETPDGTKSTPYDVRQSISTILLNPELRLNGSALLANFQLAQKCKDSKEKSILLDEQEYSIMSNAVNECKGFGANDVKFVQRILEAPEVEIAEK